MKSGRRLASEHGAIPRRTTDGDELARSSGIVVGIVSCGRQNVILLAGARWGWEEVRKSESTDSELVYDWQRRSFVLRGCPLAVMGAYASIVFIAIRFPFGRAASHSPLLLADIAPSHLPPPSHFRSAQSEVLLIA